MAATSCVRWVVTASSSTEAAAASPSHMTRAVQPGADSRARSESLSIFFGNAAACVLVRHAARPQIAAKQTNPADQTSPCMREGRTGLERQHGREIRKRKETKIG